MSTPDEVQDGVFEEIAKELKIQSSDLRSETKLSDLEASSLSVMEIVFAIEERFNVELPFSANDLAALETLGQIVDAVQSTLEPRPASA